MKNFTTMGDIKKIAMTVLLLIAGITVKADQKYYDYYSTIEAYPSGAGLVYADVDGSWVTESEDEDSPLYTDMKTPAEAIDVKFIKYSASGNSYYYANAKANEGWILQGFSQADFVDDTYNFNDSIISFSYHPQINITSSHNGKTLDEAKNEFPMMQESSYYALFTHIGYRIAEGQMDLGFVKSSNICNKIGENVTLTAIPTNTKTTRFAYWIDQNTGEKITDNPLTVNNIDRSTYYVAHFDCDSAITLTFPKDGGYKIVKYDKGYAMKTDSAYVAQFTTIDALQKNESGQAFQDIDPLYNWIYSGNPRIIYGKGEVTLVEDPEINDNTQNDEVLWSGKNGINIDTLTVTSHYYSIDLVNKQFKLLPEGSFIEPNTAYWSLTDDKIKETFGDNATVPSIVYWYDPTPTTGIEQIKDQKETKINKKNKGIYNSLGQKVKDMTTKGLYIKDGKAIYFMGR